VLSGWILPLVALPGCAPGGAVTFFCFAKRKSPKVTQWDFAHFARRSYAKAKRRAGFVVPRFARVRCVARPERGARKLAALKHARPYFRSVLRYSPPHNGEEDRIPNAQYQNNKDAPWRVLVRLFCLWLSGFIAVWQG
jgi:hypothetical protein